MPILCSICKAEYTLTSEKCVDIFCKHVAKCPIRSENPLQERYSCNICETVVRLNGSFKKHVLKFHLEKAAVDQTSNHTSSQPNKKIRLGKKFTLLFLYDS